MAAVLLGCGGDSDLDGLPDRTEAGLGTDPTNPDTDADGLTDGEEVALGSNPLSADTDGDGYSDGDEVFEGKDPVDPSSRIYTGNWPYRRDKSMFADPGTETRAWPGEPIPRLHALDQFGDTVDLADFAAPDVEILIEVCGVIWGACRELAVARTDSEQLTEWAYLGEAAMDRVRDGTGRWVTVISEGGELGSSSTYQDVLDWSDEYGDDIPILWDEDRAFLTWAWQNNDYPGRPTFVLANDDLTARHIDSPDDPTGYYGFNIFIDNF